MKKILSLYLFSLLSMTHAQDNSMLSLANAECDVQARLIPKSTHHFEAEEGTIVKISVTLKNQGNSPFELKAEEYLKCVLELRGKGIPFPVKITTFTQVQYIDSQLLKIAKRLKRVTAMTSEELLTYLKRLHPKQAFEKIEAYQRYLEEKKNHLNVQRKHAELFDKSRTVAPGAKLHFEISSVLPACEQKLGNSCEVSVMVLSSNGKRIKFPARAKFY